MDGLEEKEVGKVHIVHKSVVPLIFRLFSIVLVLILVALLLFLLVSFILPTFFGSTIDLSGFYVVIFIISLLLSATAIVYTTLDWLNEFYTVQPSKIIRRRGVFGEKEEAYDMRLIQTVSITQGFWGKIYDYGDIKLTRLGEDIELLGVPTPHHFFEYIEKYRKGVGAEREEKRKG